MKNSWLLVGLISVVLVLSGCASKPKSEPQRYQQLTNSIKFKSYRAASRQLIDKGIVVVLPQDAGPETPLQAGYLHSGIALMQLLAGNNTLALAEADLAVQSAPQHDSMASPAASYVSLSVMALSLQHNGLNNMSSAYANAASQLQTEQPVTAQFNTAQTYAKLILGVNAALTEDPDTAYLLLSAAGQELGKPWLARSVAAAALILDNPYTAAFKLNTMLQQQPLTAEERLYISQLQQTIVSGDSTQTQANSRAILLGWLKDATAASLELTAQAGKAALLEYSEAMFRLLSRN